MKAQSSIEFFAFFFLSMLILATMYTALADRQREVLKYREASDLEAVASKTAFELENAQTYGEGFSKELNLPRTISNDEYNLSVRQSYILAQTQNLNLTVSTSYSGREIDISSSRTPFEVKNNGSIYIQSR